MTISIKTIEMINSLWWLEFESFLRLSFLCFKHFERAKMMLSFFKVFYHFSFKSIILSVIDDKEIIFILRLTRGSEIYCHIEGKVYHSFQNESPSNHLEMKAKKSFQNERPFINLKLIFYKSERQFRNESHQAY